MAYSALTLGPGSPSIPGGPEIDCIKENNRIITNYALQDNSMPFDIIILIVLTGPVSDPGRPGGPGGPLTSVYI